MKQTNTLNIAITSFNPCFVGCVSGIDSLFSIFSYFPSFNPCFVGCVSGIIVLFLFCCFCQLFQSLFCWMCVGNFVRSIDEIPEDGFNPCFVGCVSGMFHNLFRSLMQV